MHLKEHAKFIASVGVAFAVIFFVQKNVYKLPVIGDYLPGGQ